MPQSTNTDRAGAVFRRPRIGLVLEGGGAKGAYAFGWLLEFAARGVYFDAVAGTSVGTLNAVLWATQQLDKGEELWATISSETVFKHRRHRIVRFPIAILYALRRLVAERIANAHSPITAAYSALLLAMVTIAPIFWFITEGIKHLIFWMIIATASDVAIAEVTYRLGRVQIPIVFMSCIWSVIYLFDPIAEKLFGFRWTGFHWKSSAPLREKIESVMTCSSLTIPVYATVAEYREINKPKKMRYWRGALGGFWFGSYCYVPIYIKLNNMSNNQRNHLILASASLPYGFTLPVQDQGRELVDGGVVDNTPIYPMIKFERCGRVVVIKLQRSTPIDKCSYTETWRKLENVLIASRLSTEEARRRQEQGEDIDVTDPTHSPKFITIAPKRPLWAFLGFLVGQEKWTSTVFCATQEFHATMKFEERYARRLIALGRADAKAQSSEFWKELGARRH